jgi:hypothetical protein
MQRWNFSRSRRAFIALFAFTLVLVSGASGFFSSAFSQTPPQRNAIIFIADGLRPGSVNATNAPTLLSVRQQGVNFANSHSLFPTFTTANGSAIATGHYLGDTGDFSNTIYAGFAVPNAGGSITPFVENDQILPDLNAQYNGNYLNEESLLALARQSGYSTASVGKHGPTLIQDVTQGNRTSGFTGTVPPPQTIIIDDRTGQTTAPVGVPLNSDIQSALTAAGLPLVAPGRGANGSSGNNTTPGTTVANVTQQQYFADATTKAILPLFKNRNKPFVISYWSRDPDGTQHNQGDSLNSLTPGINGPTSQAAVNNVDNNLAQLIQALKDQGLYDNTDIFVTADHGFSTISRHEVDATGTLTTSYAATAANNATPPGYPGVNPGFLPPGFLAIDIAHALNLPLFDPDKAATGSILTNGSINYALVDPTQGQRPANGDAVIGGTGAVVNNQTDGTIVIAANGGSDLLYLPKGNVNVTYNGNTVPVINALVDFLSSQDYVSGLFVDDKFGTIPGALPLSAINFKGTALTPTPAIAINFRTFATNANNPFNSGVEIADTGLQEGQGMHGTFGRADTFNNMAAIGPDFKKGFTDNVPVSNVDVPLTIAKILGLTLPNKGFLLGRVISEALVGGPDTIPVRTQTLRSDTNSASGQQTILNYQLVGRTRYFDAAGFPGRTVGLSS